MHYKAEIFAVENAICQFLRTANAATFLMEQWAAHGRSGVMTLTEIADETDATLGIVRKAKADLLQAIQVVRNATISKQVQSQSSAE